MLESNIKTVRTDMKALVEDAQELFREAASASGVKAEELRTKGMDLLDTAMDKAQELQAAALDASKDLADSADHYVQANPWKAIAVSAGVGLLLGMLIARK